MPDAITCPKCSTRYQTGGYQPGQRFRCRTAGCGEQLTVAASGDATPTPAPGPQRTPTVRTKKSGHTPIPAAAPVAEAVDEGGEDAGGDDTADPGEKTGSGRSKARSGSGRHGRGGSGRPAPAGRGGRGGVERKASNPWPLYVGIGGMVLILGIVVVAMMGDSPSPGQLAAKTAKKPPVTGDAPTSPTTQASVAAPSTAGTAATPDAPTTEAPKKPKPVARRKDAFKFVVDASAEARLLQLTSKLTLEEDVHAVGDACAELVKMGKPVVGPILNLLDPKDFKNEKDMTLGQFLIEDVVKPILNATDAIEKVGDVGDGFQPMGRGYRKCQEATAAWRKYWKEAGAQTVETQE